MLKSPMVIFGQFLLCFEQILLYIVESMLLDVKRLMTILFSCCSVSFINMQYFLLVSCHLCLILILLYLLLCVCVFSRRGKLIEKMPE